MPALTRLLGLGSQGSCATDVVLVATWDHLQHLSVEEVLVHLTLGLHVADTDFLQTRVAGERFFGFHYFGFHIDRLQLHEQSSMSLTLSACGRLVAFPNYFDNCFLSVHSLCIDSFDHVFN